MRLRETASRPSGSGRCERQVTHVSRGLTTCWMSLAQRRCKIDLPARPARSSRPLFRLIRRRLTSPSDCAFGTSGGPNRCGIVPPLERTSEEHPTRKTLSSTKGSTGRAVQDRTAGASGSILATALPLDSAAADLAHGRLRDQPDRALRAWLADDLMAVPARVACTAIGSQRSTTSVQLCGRFVPGLATNSIRFARCDAPRGWRAFIGTRVRPSGRAG